LTPCHKIGLPQNWVDTLAKVRGKPAWPPTGESWNSSRVIFLIVEWDGIDNFPFQNITPYGWYYKQLLLETKPKDHNVLVPFITPIQIQNEGWITPRIIVRVHLPLGSLYLVCTKW